MIVFKRLTLRLSRASPVAARPPNPQALRGVVSACLLGTRAEWRASTPWLHEGESAKPCRVRCRVRDNTRMSIVDLLGTSLKSKAGDVETATALKGKAVVALYFSAHWRAARRRKTRTRHRRRDSSLAPPRHRCPPCRGFTPVLADKYKALVGDGKAFEVVFVSSDKDEASFDEYYAEQPWLALPFGSRDVKAALSKKYKVSGIPSLVLLDGDGAIITKDGRRAVSAHTPSLHRASPTGTPSAQVCSDGGRVPVHAAHALGLPGRRVSHAGRRRRRGRPAQGGGQGDRLVLLGALVRLAAASPAAARVRSQPCVYDARPRRCPPCRGFTPELVKTVGKLKAAGKAFEIIFVSSDRDQKSFQEYFGSMGPHFLAIPQGDPRKAKLSSFFGVEGSRIAGFDEVSTAAPHLWLRCEQASRR